MKYRTFLLHLIIFILLFVVSAFGVRYLTGSGAKLTDIPVDSDFDSNGLLRRTGAGTYDVVAEGESVPERVRHR